MNHISKLFGYCFILLAVSPVLLPQRGLCQNTPSQTTTFATAAESSSVVCTLPSAPVPAATRYHLETTVSAGAAGQLTASRITDNSDGLTTQSLSPSAGVFTTFRQSFSPWLGYSVNLGYTRASYRYILAASAPNTGATKETDISSNIYETSVSYIAQKHLTSAFAVFGEAGGGAIAFAARNDHAHSSPQGFSLLYRSNTFRAEGIAGFGIDYRLGHGLGLRAEYRGLFIKYPDFASGIVRPTTISNAPTLSVTYTLGRHVKNKK